MKRIVNKYFYEIDVLENYTSEPIQITAEQYWKEFDNCKARMEEHNKDLDEDEKEFGSYEYDEETKDYGNYISIERRFYFSSCNVYLTQYACKSGYTFNHRK